MASWMLRLGMFGRCLRSSWTFAFSLPQTTSKPVRPSGRCLLDVGVTAFETEDGPRPRRAAAVEAERLEAGVQTEVEGGGMETKLAERVELEGAPLEAAPLEAAPLKAAPLEAAPLEAA